MKTKPIHHEHGQRRNVKVVILYDQLETLIVANRLLCRWPPGWPSDVDWTISSWRYDLLEQAGESARALGATVDADLMIMAMSDVEALTSWPEDWLARWAADRHGTPVSLVLVLVGAARQIEAGLAVIAPLLDLAKQNNVEFSVLEGATLGPGQPTDNLGSFHQIKPHSVAPSNLFLSNWMRQSASA